MKSSLRSSVPGDTMDSSLSSDTQTLIEKKHQPFLSTGVVLCLLLISGICLFYGISDYRKLGLHEVHASDTGRHMYLSGDYVVPYETGLPRLTKPPLAYWIVAASAHVTGAVDEFSSRVPAALFGVMLAGLMGWWAYRWYGTEAGLLTAFVQATCYYTILWARKSEVDMCLTLINVACLYLIANQPAGQTWKQGLVRGTAIFALLGLSTLAKFYYGPVLILGITGVYWLLQNRWQDVKHFFNPIGWVLWVGPFFLWALVVSNQLPNAWEVWQRETIGRATGEIGFTPFWFYVPELFYVTIPWVPLWLMELKQSWNLAWRKKDSQERFLWIWFLVPFVIVTLQPDKHINYLMTFLPVLSILAGRRLARELTAERWLSFRWTKLQVILLTIFNLGLGLLVAYGATRLWPSSERIAVSLALLTVVGFSSVAWLFYWNRQRAGVLALTGCYTALVMIFFGDIQPVRDPWQVQSEFCQRVVDEAQEKPIVGYQVSAAPSFYLGPTVWNYRASKASKQELLSKLEAHESVLIVSDDSKIDQLEKYGTLRPVLSVTEEELPHWDGKFDLLRCWEFTSHKNLDVASGLEETKTQ